MGKAAYTLGIIFLLYLTGAAQPRFQTYTSDQGIEMRWSGFQGKVTLYRCSQKFGYRDFPYHPWPFPIATLGTMEPGLQRGWDATAAPGVTYYYAAEGEDHVMVMADPIGLPWEPLPTLTNPMICIDKRFYVLEVWDGNRLVKRYPVVFGKTPLRRKLQQDRSSTPEGRYRIYQCQAKSQFHKAFDINYPTAVDKARYQLLAPGNPIGGEIEIHGDGIDDNWTWGCIAMRDEDIDELFEQIGRDTPVWIAGGELTWEDLDSDARAPAYDPARLGRWQEDQGLKPTCIFDVATRERWQTTRDQSFFK